MQKLIVQAEEKLVLLAYSAIAYIKEGAATDMAELAVLSKGVKHEDGKYWADGLVVSCSWEDVRGLAKVRLLPVDVGALEALVVTMETASQRFQDVAGQHKKGDGKTLDGIDELLMTAKLTISMHKLITAYTNEKLDIPQMRKITKDEQAKMRRIGAQVSMLPGGLQTRIAAAWKGRAM